MASTSPSRLPATAGAALAGAVARKADTAARLAAGGGEEPSLTSWQRETGLQLGGAFADGSFTVSLDVGTRGAPARRDVTVSESAEEIGTRVWDCAILMSRWFEQLAAREREAAAAAAAGGADAGAAAFLRGKRVLELGSGTGLLGIVCAALGADLVVLTDLPVLLATMERNAERNGLAGVCRARALNWNDRDAVRALLAEFGTFDVIVASDVLVFAGDARRPFLHTTAGSGRAGSAGGASSAAGAAPATGELEGGLLSTICAFAEPGATRILMGCGLNRQGFIDGFFNNPPTDLFEIERVAPEEMHPDFRTDRIVVYRMRSRVSFVP